MNSEDDPLYAVWGYDDTGEMYMVFFREAPEIAVATADDVPLDPQVAQRLAYWAWRQTHGHGEWDLEYEGRY